MDGVGVVGQERSMRQDDPQPPEHHVVFGPIFGLLRRGVSLCLCV